MQSTFPKWKLVAFTILSACDFAVTYFLLSGTKGEVYESNPVANEWLRLGGWMGLAVFKSAIVFAVAIITIYLFYRRPRIAHDLLAVGCGAVVVAVLTGTTIAFTRSVPAYDEVSSVEEGPTPLHDEVDTRTSEYLNVLDETAIRLVAREYSLESCVGFLQQTELAQDPMWINSLRRAYPGVKSDTALLAAELIQHTVSSRLRTPMAASLAERLESDFRVLYGAVPVFSYRPMLHLNGTSTQKELRTKGKSLPVPI